MKKKLQLLFILLLSIFYKGQDNSIAASVLTPVAYQTGVPDISFPLVNLPATKDLTLNFGLNYNPNSYKLGEYNGQVARNWGLSGSNFSITRKVIANLDETLTSNLEWDDIYFYNINGEQGSFRFETTGVFPDVVYHLIKLTSSNAKIECERIVQPNFWTPKYIQSFTITDSKGYKYFFQDFDCKLVSRVGGGTIEARSSFYVTKIIDPSNNQVAVFHNKKYMAGSDYSDFFFLPEEISTNYGSIKFEHEDEGEGLALRNRYYFKNITLKNFNNELILKYNFIINTSTYPYRYWDDYEGFVIKSINTRRLIRLEKLDRISTIAEKTKFEYSSRYPRKYGPSADYWGHIFYKAYTTEDPNSLMFDILNAVELPNGSKMVYDFEANKIKAHNLFDNISIDKNSASYIAKIQNPFEFTDPEIEYVEMVKEIDFDSNISRLYNITGLHNNPNSRIYIRFQPEEVYPWPDDPTTPTVLGVPPPDPKLAYKVKNAINNGSNLWWYGNEIDKQCDDCYYIVPSNGNAKIEITGSGGRGYFFIFEKLYTNPPYINETTLPNSGVRIGNIKYYDRGANYDPNDPDTSYDLKKTINFDYNFFNEVGISSGVTVPDDQHEAIIYKNIKVTESDKPGYTKYYYKTPYDFPTYPHPTIPNSTIWPNFNLTKKGILDKKEVYDAGNIKSYSTVADYVLPNYDMSKLYQYEVICGACYMGGVDPFYTQESFPLKTTTTETSYDATGNSLTNTSEQTFNQENNNLMSEKKTSADGTISETIYQYAAEKANSKLLGAGMTSVPLEVTQKRNNVQVGKLETKYEQAGNYFPSSVTSFGINNVITGEQSNELYDNMGNVLQTRSKSGMPTAIIWGYGGTQPIAKIEGGEYFTILSLLGQPNANLLDIVEKSNLDVDSSNDTNEQLLRNALEAFRKKPEFKNYLITTYTYDPLIGIKSVTSPNGMTEYYYYDNQNRMIRVEDANHNVIKENKYLQNLNTN